MKQTTSLSLIVTAGIGLALTAAVQPSALAGSKPGLWEVDGLPGAKKPVRECVGDVLALARYEHKGKTCTTNVLKDDGTLTVLEYRCGGGGFGRSEIQVVTPRNLKISTQGISDQLPFNYVLQARRVGECEKTALARH